MQVRDLRSILQAQVREYLENDNKEPESAGDIIGSFFSSSGRSGRQRAKQYRDTVLNDVTFINDDALLAQVWKDLSDDGVLATGEKLRNRMFAGLCNYLNVTKSDLNEARLQAEQNRRAFVVAASYGVVTYRAIEDIEVFKAALSPKVDAIVRAQKQNKTLTYGSDSEGL